MLNPSDDRNIYSENNFFKYLAIPTKRGVDVCDLLAAKPMGNPVKLIPTEGLPF